MRGKNPGETNTLLTLIYAPDSEFSLAIDLKNGCVRRGRHKVLNLLRRVGFFNRVCDSREESSSGVVEGAVADGDGDASVREVCDLKALRIGDLMYGLRRIGAEVGKLVVAWCRALVVDISSSDLGI